MERFNRIDAMNLPLRTIRESSMQDLPAEVTSEQARKDHEAVAILLRKNFDEYTKTTDNDGTADYLVTGLLQAQNTTLWMLRRYLP